MEVTAADVATIPRTNLRVSREEFAAIWRVAERQCAEQGQRGVTDWHAGGVAVACRWLARATVRPTSGPPRAARSPVTERTNLAYEEQIEAEFVAAEQLDMQQPRPTWLHERPGWSEAICATLRWAWRRAGPAPLQVDEAAAS